MKKVKSLNFIIPLVVYPFDVMFSFGQTDDELKKCLGKYNVEWDENMKCIGQGRFVMTAANQSLVRLYNYPESCEEYGSLQHEIFHAVTHVLDRIGMKFVLLKSDEAYSYLVGYLTTEVYKKLK
jgi:hypothetical protein